MAFVLFSRFTVCCSNQWFYDRKNVINKQPFTNAIQMYGNFLSLAFFGVCRWVFTFACSCGWCDAILKFANRSYWSMLIAADCCILHQINSLVVCDFFCRSCVVYGLLFFSVSLSVGTLDHVHFIVHSATVQPNTIIITSVIFELDVRYWSSQQALRTKLLSARLFIDTE